MASLNSNRIFTSKMNRCNAVPKKGQIIAGLPKFRLYAEPRGFCLLENSYGFYRVKHRNKTSILEACRATTVAVDSQGQEVTVEGWVINLANRQRTFKADGTGYEVFPLKL